MTRYILTQLSGIAERQHQWLIGLALVVGLIGMPGYANAGPVLIPMEDDGGNGSMHASANEGTTARLFDEVLSEKTSDVCALLMAAGAITHTPHGDFTGPAGFEQYVAGAWSAFPDATFSIDERTSSTDHVTVRWTMTGRHLGDFGSYGATGAILRLEGVAILRFEGGMISESWFQYDRMSLGEQIESAPANPDICPPCELP